eukprot:jgi/Chrzof1/5369/Cz16g00100.t1
MTTTMVVNHGLTTHLQHLCSCHQLTVNVDLTKLILNNCSMPSRALCIQCDRQSLQWCNHDQTLQDILATGTAHNTLCTKIPKMPGHTCNTLSMIFGQDVVQQGGLARAQEPSDHLQGKAAFHPCCLATGMLDKSTLGVQLDTQQQLRVLAHACQY